MTQHRTDPESARLDSANAGQESWREWGPYVAERAWGTVREDYSASGDAWDDFPFSAAVSRSYRWNEDGFSAWSDREQNVCLGLALWNGADPILKERPFGLSGPQGNHGEDAKDYWWYVDNTPTHSWVRNRYAYPLAEFPYQQLIDGNAARDRQQPEYELIDTGIFAADRYVMITSDWAKAGPRDICVRFTFENRSTEQVRMHALPTVWYRNNWSWQPDADKPRLWAADSVLRGYHDRVGNISVVSSGDAELLFCENETNVRKLYGTDTFAGSPATRYPKDGINDHVVSGAPSVNPEQYGTKAAFHHLLTIEPGSSAEVRIRLRCDDDPGELSEEFDQLMRSRSDEADQFWQPLLADQPAGRRQVSRQAFAGLLSSKQFYAYDLRRWLQGDPGQPAPPASRWSGRNSSWQHLVSSDLILMPDPWEYPWFAAWDLAFHCVAMASVDPEFAKQQLLLLLHEWYQHPDGQLPAYEWRFGDVNPPVQAWAVRQIFLIDGEQDTVFLERAIHKLLINFTWWVNRKDDLGNNLFEGGFLGLDNIGPFDRSQPLPGDAVLEQSDGTAWMAMFCLDMLNISVALSDSDHTYDDVATKFLEHFCYIATAANDLGLWDEEANFYFDQIRSPDGEYRPVPVKSAVGLIPIIAVTRLTNEVLDAMPQLADRLEWYRLNRPEFADAVHFDSVGHRGLLAVCDPDRLITVLRTMLDTSEFLSPYGLRSLSADHGPHPATISIDGQTFSVNYEPAESQTAMFGGNSNWRGPIWFPLNALLISALRRYGAYCGDALMVDYPTGSGHRLSLDQVADKLTDRLMSMFLPSADGQRPCQAGLPWQDDIFFHEYVHADTGFGLGASHQTGWTALIASMALGWPR